MTDQHTAETPSAGTPANDPRTTARPPRGSSSGSPFRLLVLGLAAVLMALAGTAASASPSSAAPAASIGGVSMADACSTQYPGQGLSAQLASQSSSTAAYTWACVKPGTRLGIDVAGACARQYGYGATAGLTSAADPYSWYCLWRTTRQMQSAVAWAVAEKNSPLPAWSDRLGRPWSGFCESLVFEATGFPHAFPSAAAHYQWQKDNGRLHTNGTPPPGAVVFWGGAQGYGHVAVSVGGGQVIGTLGSVGQRLPVSQYPVTGYLSNPYLGWAYPWGS